MRPAIAIPCILSALSSDLNMLQPTKRMELNMPVSLFTLPALHSLQMTEESLSR